MHLPAPRYRGQDFEGSASLALQARRLRVEQFELSLVIASVSIAAGGIVPGAMGMNLVSGYESSERLSDT
eukprot:g29980.t1